MGSLVKKAVGGAFGLGGKLGLGSASMGLLGSLLAKKKKPAAVVKDPEAPRSPDVSSALSGNRFNAPLLGGTFLTGGASQSSVSSTGGKTLLGQ